MLFKKTNYRNKVRTLLDPVHVIRIELSDQVLQVERVYPNIINLFSDFGSILKVLVFLCIATGSIHNQILLDRYLLDSIFGQENRLGPTGAEETEKYNNWNILTLKYMSCCWSKSNKRREKYEQHMRLIAERMDMLNLVKHSQNSQFLATTLLNPYQLAILSKFMEPNDNQIQKAKAIEVREALKEFGKS